MSVCIYVGVCVCLSGWMDVGVCASMYGCMDGCQRFSQKLTRKQESH